MRNGSPEAFEAELAGSRALIIRQRRELAELFGFETRNKYQIQTEDGREIGYAAEQQRGFLGFLARQFLGHWRSFDIHVLDGMRQPVFIAHHPFRWFFQRLEVRDVNGKYHGAIQREFAIFNKKFLVEDALGRPILQVASPFFRIWTFDFLRQGRVVASVKKRWSGVLKEVFTDADNFLVELHDPSLTVHEKALVLIAGIFVDLMYFEQKGDGGALHFFDP